MAIVPNLFGEEKSSSVVTDLFEPSGNKLQSVLDVMSKFNPMQYMPGVELTKNVSQDVLDRLFAGGTQTLAAGVRGLQGRETTPIESILKKGLVEKEPATMQDWFTEQAIKQKEEEYQKELETAKGMGGIKGFFAKPALLGILR